MSVEISVASPFLRGTAYVTKGQCKLLCLCGATVRVCRAATARVIVRALRLLFAQLKLLKLDAANARLRMLSATLGEGVAAECASSLTFASFCG